MSHQPFVAWLVSNEYSPATIQKYTRALARFFAETGAGTARRPPRRTPPRQGPAPRQGPRTASLPGRFFSPRPGTRRPGPPGPPRRRNPGRNRPPRAPQTRRPVAAHIVRHKMRTCAPQTRREPIAPCATNRDPVAAHSVRHKNADPFATKPRRGTRSGRACTPLAHRTAMANNVRRYGGLYAPRPSNGHGEQCSPLRSRHFVRPAPKPRATCSGAQRAPQNADLFVTKMRTRSPRNRGGAHVPAGPVRPSPDERPWRTMFAATVSAFCTLCAETPCHL